MCEGSEINIIPSILFLIPTVHKILLHFVTLSVIFLPNSSRVAGFVLKTVTFMYPHR